MEVYISRYCLIFYTTCNRYNTWSRETCPTVICYIRDNDRLPKMKEIISTFVVIPVTLFILFNAIVFAIVTFNEPGIEESVVNNISIAQEMYQGNAEDALIAFLQDSSNSCNDRSHIAIWTLGQIKSGKALPIIKALYLDDPSGVTCNGRHDSVICQRVLHNAIVAIESKKELHADLNK